jgi:large subunit ribosomal protein L30
MAKTLLVKLLKGYIGCTKGQKATLEAIGLKKINQIKKHQDCPAIRGQIMKVQHLVELQVES